MEFTTKKGYVISIDEDDVPRVLQHVWEVYRFGRNNIYATTDVGGKTIYLHRFIMGTPSGVEVDHRDGNGLRNVRSNLREATHAQNLANQRLSIANKSGVRGVYFAKGRTQRPWHAQIKHRGKNISLGYHETLGGARDARLAKERELFGDFAPAQVA